MAEFRPSRSPTPTEAFPSYYDTMYTGPRPQDKQPIRRHTCSVKVHGPATYGAGLGRNTGLPGRVLGGHTLCYVNTYTAATPTETASAAPAQQKQYTLGQK